MTTSTPTITLTAEQIAAYHRDGYLALEAITTPTLTMDAGNGCGLS